MYADVPRYYLAENFEGGIIIRDLTSVYEGVITIHAEGYMAAQRLTIVQLADLDRWSAVADTAVGMQVGTSHTIYAELPQFPPTT
jgi:4-hydroxybutyryl-CoA dehydratase / vinylacetyl-CoA-Delta-isomerase